MADDPIRGWKEIANYLGTSERTAQRWETLHNLPIRRMASDRASVVSAIPSELDAWRRTVASLSDDREAESGSDQVPTDAQTNGAAPETHTGNGLRRGRLALSAAVVAMAVLALVVWLVANRATGARAPQVTAAPAGSPVIFLQVQAPNAAAFKTGVRAGGTGAVELPNRPRVLLSPTLIGDMVRLRVSAVEANGSPDFIAIIDLRRGAKATVDRPYKLEIVWVGLSQPRPPAPNLDTAGR